MSKMQGTDGWYAHTGTMIGNGSISVHPCAQATVKSVTRVNVMCLMCDEEKATVTVKPCGHQYCPGLLYSNIHNRSIL